MNDALIGFVGVLVGAGVAFLGPILERRSSRIRRRYDEMVDLYDQALSDTITEIGLIWGGLADRIAGGQVASEQLRNVRISQNIQNARLVARGASDAVIARFGDYRQTISHALDEDGIKEKAEGILASESKLEAMADACSQHLEGLRES